MYLRRFAALLVLFALGGTTQGAPAEAKGRGITEAVRTPALPGPSTRIAPAPARARTAAIAAWPERIEARLAEIDADASSQDPRAPVLPDASAALQLEVATLLAELGARTEVALHVRALGNGAALADRDGDRLLNPASNHKLLTAIAALELLGPDYRFVTRVLVDGDALVVVGEGDPSLQPEDLSRLAERVRAGIDLSKIRRIVIDDGMFSADRFGPGYDPQGPGFSYMAPSGALSLQWNTVQISVEPARRGEPVAVFVDPPCSHVRVVNEGTTGRGAPLTIETTQDGDDTVVHVRGALSSRARVQTIRRRVQDPGRFTASVLAARLADELADVPLTRGRASSSARPVAEHFSAPLAQLLDSALKFSNNFTTEQLLRTIAYRMNGTPGDWHAGALALRRFWRALGKRDAELVFENASGYSRSGRLSARALVDLLVWSQRPGSRSHAVLAALPVSGVDGTLRDRLLDTGGRVLAKTGTLEGASALSGVVVDETGVPRIAFSLLLNGRITGHDAHALQDRLVRLLLAHA
ncbi:MAG TPA: D-alanyl-D-alanine carboxypeptidase/D-alanyl-D-alanine-endopeptidase [Nannocystaceae bacterium]|nr:D-alanyl-D-alanine carboxypeptidase/D-alanyl-D-alanine-endopeptidase [Nannocystaceae bacterium]